jgi:hypothetical protein
VLSIGEGLLTLCCAVCARLGDTDAANVRNELQIMHHLAGGQQPAQGAPGLAGPGMNSRSNMRVHWCSLLHVL